MLDGELWNGGTNPSATCLRESWKSDPRFLEFAAAARWILDPVDPVNYAGRYDSSRSVLLAEVVGDPVIPNSATQTWGSALGLAPELAGLATPGAALPSPGLLEPGSHWLRYAGVELEEIIIETTRRSGLRDATEVLRDVDGISFTFFNSRDVVRHPLVQRIVRAYEAREAETEDSKATKS